VRTAAALVGAVALTLPLAFLFWGVPAFMIPAAGSDANEAPSLPLWLTLWFAMPVLICAVRLSALRRVFGGGTWLRRLSVAAWAVGGAMGTGALIGLRFCLLGC
jgi:hypothetical protein